MKKKNGFALVGIIVSCAVIVLGLLVLFGVFKESTASVGYTSYDSGYTKFGGDFYTYSNNNTALAAANARATAWNVSSQTKMITKIGGMILVALGCFSFCFFGYLTVNAKNAATAGSLPEPMPQDGAPYGFAPPPEQQPFAYAPPAQPPFAYAPPAQQPYMDPYQMQWNAPPPPPAGEMPGQGAPYEEMSAPVPEGGIQGQDVIT